MTTIGIDEVGRGSWAGPLVAAAVILTNTLDGLTDSKKLSRSQREKLHTLIRSNGRIGLGWVSASQIDKLGLTQATKLSMSRALINLNYTADEVIIDGNFNYLVHLDGTKAIVKADNQIPAVSAASIVAKVARDLYMRKVAIEFSQYGFEKHVGYGTAEHRLALSKHGLCELHRKSFRPIKEYA